MGQFDMRDEVAEAVRDADAVSRFVRRFAEWTGRAVQDGDGCSERELDAAEGRLGVHLPRTLRECHALIGRRRDLTCGQDRLRRVEELRVEDGVLVFRDENQHVTAWGVRLEDIGQDDPPVGFRDAQDVWRPYLERFSLAVVEVLLSEWVMTGEEFHDNKPLDDGEISLVEQRFQRLALPDHPLWPEPGGAPVRWFAGTDVVMRMDGRQWLWVRATTADGIAGVRELLPGEWLLAER